jgi:hypothetical protein
MEKFQFIDDESCPQILQVQSKTILDLQKFDVIHNNDIKFIKSFSLSKSEKISIIERAMSSSQVNHDLYLHKQWRNHFVKDEIILVYFVDLCQFKSCH